MKEIETVEQVYDRIAPHMSRAWGKKDVAMMVAKVYASQFQPKWIKINSESDLPKEKGDYWIANENGVFDFIASRDQIKAKFENNTCTHYMRFFKPQPPKED